MRIYLDLLPPERKSEIKRAKLFRGILYEEFLFFIPILVFIFILANTYYVLSRQRDLLVNEQNSNKLQGDYQKLNEYETKFNEVNARSQTLVKIQTNHLYWQQLFIELSGLLPEEVYLTDLSTKDFAVFIVGKAKTRDDLLNFKSKLENSKCFENVNVPLSNLVVKEDVDFQIDFKIKENCLKKQ
jgi:Tfp pilus assembly protein PilN